MSCRRKVLGGCAEDSTERIRNEEGRAPADRIIERNGRLSEERFGMKVGYQITESVVKTTSEPLIFPQTQQLSFLAT